MMGFGDYLILEKNGISGVKFCGEYDEKSEGKFTWDFKKNKERESEREELRICFLEALYGKNHFFLRL